MCALFETSNMYTGSVVNDMYQEKWPNWFYPLCTYCKNSEEIVLVLKSLQKINILWGFVPFGHNGI